MTLLEILPGTMMIREGMLLPESAQLESCHYSKSWRALIGVDSFAFDQKLSGTGLRLFSLAGELKALEFGWGPSAVRRALNRIFSRLRKLDVNCMQVTEIESVRILGLPCVAIRADSFHVQSGWWLQSRTQRRSEQNSRDWACE